MSIRHIALLFGIGFLLVGLLGFIPAMRTDPASAPALAMDHSYGYLFGLFPVNLLHNLVHLAFGVWGVIAVAGNRGARTYLQVTGVIYALLVLMGLVPGMNTTFGLVPIFGHDIWLHAVIAIPALYFGFFARQHDTFTGSDPLPRART
jgi:hypothetical protein